MKEAPDTAHQPARATLGSIGDAVSEAVSETIAGTIAEVKPRLRGWLHLGTWPLALAAFVVLVGLSPTEATRIGSALFGASALLLFGVSAAYHRGNWSPRVHAVLKRFDHANIFLLIAGSYTPFSIILLHGAAQDLLLTLVWAGAIAGVFFRVFWNDAPRWLYVPIYLALGWAAVFFIPAFLHGATALGVGVGVAIFVLLCVGGALYTVGGAVYGFKRPNPSPTWFGFHEVFHTFTVLAFASHYAGVSLAVYALR